MSTEKSTKVDNPVIKITPVPPIELNPTELIPKEVIQSVLKMLHASLKRLDNIKNSETRSIVFLDRMLSIVDMLNGFLLQYMTYVDPELRQEIKTFVDLLQKEITNLYNVIQKDNKPNDTRSF